VVLVYVCVSQIRNSRSSEEFMTLVIDGLDEVCGRVEFLNEIDVLQKGVCISFFVMKEILIILAVLTTMYGR
jgi:hypothetical protein